MSDKKRMLFLEDGQGPLKLEIPADAKLTYGPVLPRMGGDNVLRVYNGPTVTSGLLALIPNVKYLIDDSVKIFRAQVVDGKDEWKEDDGWFAKAVEAEARLAGRRR